MTLYVCRIPLGAVQHLLIYKVCVPVRGICVRMHTRWVVHVPIRVGSVEPRKSQTFSPSPALLFTNLVNLNDAASISSWFLLGTWEGWVWT